MPASLALALLALCGSATPVVAPHPDSRSISRLVVDGARVQLDLRVQVASVLEVVDADRNLDLWLSAEELDASRGEIAAYLLDHFVLRTDSGGAPEGGRRLEGAPLAMVIREEVGGLIPEQWVVSTFTFEDEREVTDLLVEMTLFLLTSPDHRDVSQLIWHGDALPATVFFMGDFRRRFAPDAVAAEQDAADAMAAEQAAADAEGAAGAGAERRADGKPGCSVVGFSDWGRGLVAVLGDWIWIPWFAALFAGARTARAAGGAAVVAIGTMLATVGFGLGGGAVSSAGALGVLLPGAMLLTAGTTLAIGARARWPEALAFGVLFGAALLHRLVATGVVVPGSLPAATWVGLGGTLAVVATGLMLLGLAVRTRGSEVEPAPETVAPRAIDGPPGTPAAAVAWRRAGFVPVGVRSGVALLVLVVALWRFAALVRERL